MDGKRVFISYKVEEFDQALWVKNNLEENGISCWMAPMSIRGGMSYAQEIPKAIGESSIFVLILSEKAQQSKWVPRELDQAINCGKVIMPFVLEDCPLKNDFSFYLTNVQRYDAFRDMEGTMARMVRDIQKMLGIEPPKVEKPEPEVKTPVEPPKAEPPVKQRADGAKENGGKKKKPILPLVIVGAVLLLAIIVVLLLPKGNEIAGLKFEADAFSVRLEGVTITRADLKMFQEFQDLTVIHLKDCTIESEDLSQLVTGNLMVLEMTNCNLSDAQLQSIDFAQIPFFRELIVPGNPDLTDFSALAPCADELTHLDISGSSATDFQWLKSFTKLEILSANNTALRDLGVLEGMIYLEELRLSGNGISSLAGLENTSKLMEVDLSGNALADVSVLSRSVGTLTYLDLQENQLADLSCLSGATALRYVFVDHNQLTDLDWLKNKQELLVVTASHNQIGSISGLRIGSKLRYLNLADNLLESVGAGDIAFGDGNFVVLDLCNNRLTTVELPQGCTYKALGLLGNPNVELSRLSGLKGWDVYFDFPADVKLETLKELSFNNLCMVGCPLNRQVEIEEGLQSEELLTLEEALAQIEKRAEESIY